MPDRFTDTDSAAEGSDALEDGLRRFRERDLEGAHEAFERAHRRARSDARAMSWYGVTLVLVERNSNLGVLYCDQALRAEGPTPELLINQARVALALGQRERAVRSIARGIEIWPDHGDLQLAKEALGWRRQPVVPFVGRSNLLNRWFGRLRHKWKQRRRPVPELSPLSLGMPPPPRQE